MDSLKDKYLNSICTADSLDNLAENTGRFLNSQNLIKDFAIVKHDFSPNTHQIVFSDQNQKIGPDFIKDICQLRPPVKPIQDISINGKHFVFWDHPYTDAPGYYLYSNSSISNNVSGIVRYWQTSAKLVKNVIEKSTEKNNLSTGSLVSQIMHDIYSLINVINTDSFSGDARARADYQEKINRDLLFWVRDLETLNSQVNLKEVIESSLSLINVDWQNLKAFLVASDYEIILDVELFSKAFNEIVKNAIDGTEGDLSKIEISAHTEQSHSPFFNFEWFKISISDQGEGIAADYMNHITSPFFTTKKKEGKAGFGLSIAHKIIRRHRGELMINSQKKVGTKVDIYLPGISI